LIGLLFSINRTKGIDRSGLRSESFSSLQSSRVKSPIGMSLNIERSVIDCLRIVTVQVPSSSLYLLKVMPALRSGAAKAWMESQSFQNSSLDCAVEKFIPLM